MNVETGRPAYDAFMALLHEAHERMGELPASVWMTRERREALLSEVEEFARFSSAYLKNAKGERVHPKTGNPLTYHVHGVLVGEIEVLPPPMKKTTSADGTTNCTFHVFR